MLTPGSGVIVDVQAAGVSFPEVLQTRGEYQFKPDLPFVPGAEVAGTCAPRRRARRCRRATASPRCPCSAASPRSRSRPTSSRSRSTRSSISRRARALDPQLPHRLLLPEAAGPPRRGRDRPRARRGGRRRDGVDPGRQGPRRAKTIAVVSSDEKEQVARDAGADEVVRSDGPWKDEAKALGGADVIIDPVGGDRFTDSLRSLEEGGPARRRRLHRRLDPRGARSTACCSTTPRSSAPAGART